MADLRYRVEIDTSGAQSSLEDLKGTIATIAGSLAAAFSLKEIATVSARFQDLRTTLGILYKDTEVGAQAFDQIKQFATQSVFSVEDLTESVVKLKAAGLEPTIEQLRLFSDVSSISTDRIGALQAITDLFARTTAGGLGLEDLNRLADRGIPVFTILQDKLGKSRLELTELGKTAEGAQLILAALSQGLQEAFGGAQEASANNLSIAMSNLKDAISNAFDTIGVSGFNQAVTEVLQNLTTWINNNQELIVAIGQGLATAIRIVAENAKYLAALFAGVFAAAVVGKIIAITRGLLLLADGFKKAAIGATLLQAVTGVGLVKVIAGVGAAAATIYGIEKAFESSSTSAKGLNDQLDKLAKGGPLTGGNQAAEQVGKVRDQYGKVITDYRTANNLQLENMRNTRDQIGLTQQQRDTQQALLQLQTDYTNRVKVLRDQLALLNKEPQKNQQQIQAINETIGQMTAEYNRQVGAVKQVQGEIGRARQSEEARLQAARDYEQTLRRIADAIKQANSNVRNFKEDYQFQTSLINLSEREQEVAQNTYRLRKDMQNALAPLEERLLELRGKNTDAARKEAAALQAGIATIKSTYGEAIGSVEALVAAREKELAILRQKQELERFNEFTTRAAIDANEQVIKLQDEMAKMTLPAIEQKYYDIEAAAKANARAAIAAEEARRGTPLSQAEQEAYYRSATAGVEKLRTVTKQHHDMSRSWSTGWKRAMNDYVDEATNAAKQAETLFKKTTQGMEDAFVNFAKTGKFEWKSFVSDIAETLLRSNLQNLIAKVFGPANAPKAPATASAGQAAAQPQAQQSNTGGFLGAIGKLLGFANGGIIPTNGPVLVGERGPELLSGAAGRYVTPNNQLGGTTMVTYNINAVDALSFRQLVARDPGFIHAVATKGGSSVPVRR